MHIYVYEKYRELYVHMTCSVTWLFLFVCFLFRSVSWPSFQARRFVSSFYSCPCSIIKPNCHLFEQLPIDECLSRFPFFPTVINKTGEYPHHILPHTVHCQVFLFFFKSLSDDHYGFGGREITGCRKLSLTLPTSSVTMGKSFSLSFFICKLKSSTND